MNPDTVVQEPRCRDFIQGMMGIGLVPWLEEARLSRNQDKNDPAIVFEGSAELLSLCHVEIVNSACFLHVRYYLVRSSFAHSDRLPGVIYA